MNTKISIEDPVERSIAVSQQDEQITSAIHSVLASSPDVITIGQAPVLSNRKARKLANRYRGTSRGERYAQYLAGNSAGFLVHNNRLVRMPKFGKISSVPQEARS